LEVPPFICIFEYGKLYIMSTNYYLKRIPTREEIEKTKRLLDEGKIESTSGIFGWDKDKDCAAQDMISQMTESVHIGLFTDGWEFSFRVHDDLYGRKRAEVFEYIRLAVKTGFWRLINEYNEDVTLGQFKERVNSSKGGLTFKTDPNNATYLQFVKDSDYIAEDGSWWVDNDFC
jgi:hypothetical protein